AALAGGEIIYCGRISARPLLPSDGRCPTDFRTLQSGKRNLDEQLFLPLVRLHAKPRLALELPHSRVVQDPDHVVRARAHLDDAVGLSPERHHSLCAHADRSAGGPRLGDCPTNALTLGFIAESEEAAVISALSAGRPLEAASRASAC